MLSIVEALSASGTETVNITGGEPLLFPRLSELVEYCSRRFGVIISTNGMLLDRESLSDLAPTVRLFGISLDTVISTEAKLMRGQDYDLQRIMSVLEILASLHVQFKINTVVTKYNINNLDATADFIRSLDQNATWKLYELTVNKNVSDEGRQIMVTKEQFNSCIMKLRVKYPSLHLTGSDSHTMNSGYVIITPNGDAHIPERHNFRSLGNILRQPLRDILFREHFNFDLNRKILSDLWS
jgi:MoaA/NifB/PqqE/SkfB family radical SAM enzyme